MKIALVTGANRGLGQGLVQVLSTKSYAVYAGTRHHQPDAAINGVTYLPLDVTSDTSIESAVTHIRRAHGRLDLLINNAGVSRITATDNHPERVIALQSLNRRDLLHMLDVNAISPLIMAKAAVPLMTNDQCFIINISSDRASNRTPDSIGNYGYSASKAALNRVTNCLVRDLPPNIATFAVHPGWVKTDMNPKGVIEPADAAERIVAITEHWRPELNGQFLNNDGALFEAND